MTTHDQKPTPSKPALAIVEYNPPRPWVRTRAAGSEPVSRRELAQWLGSKTWTLYECLFRARDQSGLVRYRRSTLCKKFAAWRTKSGRPCKPPSPRMMTYYLQRLEDVGLVVPTGRRTSGGCTYRRVFGVPMGDPEKRKVSSITEKLLHAGPLPPLSSRVHAGSLDQRTPDCSRVARQIAPRRGAQLGNDVPLAGAKVPNPPTRAGAVVAEEVAGVAFSPSEKKADVVPTPASPLFLKMNSGGRSRPKTQAVLPNHFPPHPSEFIGHYEQIRHPRVGATMGDELRVKLLLNAYRAAVEYHTRAPCQKFSRGIKNGGFLLESANLLLKAQLAPTIFAAYYIAVCRAETRERGEAFAGRVPDIRRVFAPQTVRAFVDSAREAALTWRGPVCDPPSKVWLCELWSACRHEAKLAIRSGRPQEDVDAVVARYFPCGRYQTAVDAAFNEMKVAQIKQIGGLRRGRWVWNDPFESKAE